MTHELEGRNLFQWKHEYDELCQLFVKYAQHTTPCIVARAHHWHRDYTQDNRACCSEAPCTCGLLVVLGVMNHPTPYGFQCPDVPTPVRSTLWGLPVRTIRTELPKPIENEQDTPPDDEVS